MADTRKHLPLIAIACLLVYVNTLWNGFIWDDYFLIVDNRFLSTWRNVPNLFASNVFAGAGLPSAFYRPIQSLTYMIEYQLLWGLKPFGYHLVNVLLHLGNAILIYLLLASVASRRAALIAGLLFAVHPVNTEAITYIAGRADPLALGFMLLSLLTYRQAQEGGPWQPWSRVASLAAFGLALLSKEMATILPALLILYDLVSDPPAHARDARSRWRRFLPYLIILTLYGGLRLVIPDLHRVPGGMAPGIGIGRRLLLALRVLGDYLSLLLVPRELHMERTVPIPTSLFDPPVLGGLVALCVILGLAWWGWRRSRPMAFGIGWFLIGFLPISNLVPLNARIAEHWMYLPAIGLFFAIGLGVEGLSGIRRQQLATASLTIALLAYSAVAARRNLDWKDEETFYALTLKSAPDSARIHVNQGDMYLRKGELDRSMKAFQSARAVSPFDILVHLGMGRAYVTMGRDTDAITQFENALLLYPRSAMAHLHLAQLYTRMGRQDRAVQHYGAAPQLQRRGALASVALGDGYVKARDYTAAVQAYRGALELDPANPLIRGKLGWVYGAMGQDERAREEYERALQFDPNHALVRNNLGATYLRMGQFQAAADQLQKALTLVPDYADAHSNLAVALHQMGRQQEAEREIRKALALQPDSGEIKKNLEVVTRPAAIPNYSLSELERAVKANPASAQAHYNLGSAYGNRGDLEKASKEFQAALRLDPRNPLIHYAIGLLHYQRDERRQAQRAWERALEIDPAFATARERLAELRATAPQAERAR